MSITEQATPMTEDFGPVGAELAQARVAHGLSVEDICRRTNIRPAVVTALEEGDIGPSGGAVYARGHVRTLAHALGLDAAPLLAAFDQAHGTESSAPLLTSDSDAAEVSLRPNGPPVTGPRWPLVMGAVLIVVIVIALVQLLLPSGNDSKKGASVVTPVPAKVSAPHSTAAAKPGAPSLVFPVPAEGVTVRIVLSSKPSWLDISDERGMSLIKRLVNPSAQPLDLHAAGALHVTVGAAGVAALSCNGHPLGALGGPTQVVSFTLTRGSAQCPAG